MKTSKPIDMFSVGTGKSSNFMLWRFTGVATICGCFGLNMVKYKITRVAARRRQNSEQLVANEAMARARVSSALQDCESLTSAANETSRKVSANTSIVTRGGLEVRGASSSQGVADEESVVVVPTTRIDAVDTQDVAGTILGIHNVAIVTPQMIKFSMPFFCRTSWRSVPVKAPLPGLSMTIYWRALF